MSAFRQYDRPLWARCGRRTTSKADSRNVTLHTSLRRSLEKCEHAILDTLNSKPYGHFAGGTAIRSAFRAGRIGCTECLAWRHSRRSLPAGGDLSRARRLDASSQQAGELQYPPYSQSSRRLGHNRSLSVDSPSHVHVGTPGRGIACVDVKSLYWVGHLVSPGDCPVREISPRRALDARETSWVCRLYPKDQTFFALAVLKTAATIIRSRSKTYFWHCQSETGHGAKRHEHVTYISLSVPSSGFPSKKRFSASLNTGSSGAT
jgi:hypothetical protein